MSRKAKQGEKSTGKPSKPAKPSPIKTKSKSNGVTNETNRDVTQKSWSGTVLFLWLFCFSLPISIFMLTEYKDGPVSDFIEFTVSKEYGEIIIGHINDDLVPLVDTIKEQLKDYIVFGESATKTSKNKDVTGEKDFKDMQIEKAVEINSEVFSNTDKETNEGGKEAKTREIEEKKMEEAKMSKTNKVKIKIEKELKKSIVKENEELKAVEQKRDAERNMADKEAEKEVQKRKASLKVAALEEEAFQKAQSQMEEAVKESKEWAEREKEKEPENHRITRKLNIASQVKE